MRQLKVLVACEYSGRTRRAFRALGHDAWSCDLLPAEDGNDAEHYICDWRQVYRWDAWDLVIAHPPCTHLCSSGARWWPQKRADGSQQVAIDFFMEFTQLTCAWAIENPIGIMGTIYRSADQIIQPWMFGHGETKATCLWLHGLPPLIPTNIVDGREARCHRMPQSAHRWKDRSRTYPGVADAMARQWSEFLCPTRNALSGMDGPR